MITSVVACAAHIARGEAMVRDMGRVSTRLKAPGYVVSIQYTVNSVAVSSSKRQTNATGLGVQVSPCGDPLQAKKLHWDVQVHLLSWSCVSERGRTDGRPMVLIERVERGALK